MADYYSNIHNTHDYARNDVQAKAVEVRNSLKEDLTQAQKAERDSVVWDSASMIPAAVRAYDRRNSQFEKDEDFVIDTDMQTSWDSEYSENEIEVLAKSRSQEHMIQIKKDIEEDRNRAQKLAEYGSAGIVLTTMMSLLDPPSLLLSAATGGYSNIANGAKLARALKLGGVGASEMAIYEATMAMSDTQQSLDSVYTGLAVGGAIGGTLGALTRAKVADTVEDFDASIVKDAERSLVNSQEKRIRELDATTTKDRYDPTIDHNAVSSAITEHESKLKQAVIKPTATPKKIQQTVAGLKKKAEKVKQDFDAVVKRQRDNTQKLGDLHKLEATEATDVAKKVAKLESSAQSNLKTLKAKADKLEGNPSKQAKFYNAKKNYDDAVRKLESDINEVRLTSRTKVKKAREAAVGTRTKRVTAKNKTLSRINNAISKLEKSIPDAKSYHNARSKLAAWEKMSRDERAELATGGEYPRVTLNEQKAEVQSMLDTQATRQLDETTNADSASAQRVGDTGSEPVFDTNAEDLEVIKRLMDEGANIEESAVPKAVYSKLGQPVADRLQALHTTLGNSKSYVVRGLNNLLFESAQGGKVRGLTASAVQENNKRQILGAMRYRLQEGYEDFIKEQYGKGKFKAALMDSTVRNDFNKKVMLKVDNPDLPAGEGITKAADGVRDLYAKALEVRKAAGEAGFDKVKGRDNYVTKVISPTLYKRAVAKMGALPAKQLLSRGYQEGYYKLGKETADKLADARHTQLLEGNLTVKSAMARQMDDAGLRKLEKDLESAGVDRETIDDLLKSKLEDEIEGTVSNRAKKSLDPSLSATADDGTQFVDIIDSDLGSMVESYARESAGSAALAKIVGARTPAQMDRILRIAERSLINSGRMSEKRIKEEMLMIKDGVDMLLGKSINKDAGSPLVQGLSRLRDLTGLLRLQNMGLASIPETARSITSYGLGAVMEGVPNLGVFSTRSLRGGSMSGKLQRADLEELDEIMSYYGDDWALHNPNMRYDSFEDIGQTGKFNQLLDTAIAQGRRLQGVTSGFRALQGSGEKIALRALSSRLKKQLLYGEKPLKQFQIDDAGWSDGFMDVLGDWMKKNPKKAQVNGREIDTFNFEAMPPEMQERLQVGMQRLVYRDMQRMNVGEQSTFMNKWLGQTLFQFRGFPIASVEKQLVHDISADAMHASQTMMVSAGMAYMALAIQTNLNSFGKPDDYVKNNLTGTNAVMNVIGRMGQTSAVSLVGDGLATLGALPDEMYSGQGRMGYKAMGADYIPVVGAVNDGVTLAQDLIGLTTGDTTSKQLSKDVQNIVPFMKTIGVGQAISHTIAED